MQGGLFNPITVEQIIAALPSHYERSSDAISGWKKKSASNIVLQSPNKTTINIGDKGYILSSQIELDLSQAASWDAISPTDYTVAANRAGKDFYIYACQPSNSGPAPKTLLSANSTVPTGYDATNSRKVGGFHCLCVAVGTISGHPLSGYLVGDILPASVWDLKHRPASNPEGMVFSEAANIWVDIYLQSGTGANTASVYGATITDTRNWMDFVDDAGAVKKRLLGDIEFQLIAVGSNEKTNIQGSADPNTTGGHVDTAGRRMISNIGCEDCCGAMWQWLDEQSYRYDGGSHTHAFTGSALATHTHTENQEASYTQNVQTAATSAGTPAGTNASVDPVPSWAWYTLPGDKGSLYEQGSYGDVKMLAGAGWANGASSGSRSRYAFGSRGDVYATLGCRLAAARRAEPA